MEAVIKISKCEEDQKVKFAAHSLVFEALFRWDSIQQTLGNVAVDALTWNEFKGMVLERFCPKFAINKSKLQFSSLRFVTFNSFSTPLTL